jgi:hypothetical protein
MACRCRGSRSGIVVGGHRRSSPPCRTGPLVALMLLLPPQFSTMLHWLEAVYPSLPRCVVVAVVAVYVLEHDQLKAHTGLAVVVPLLPRPRALCSLLSALCSHTPSQHTHTHTTHTHTHTHARARAQPPPSWLPGTTAVAAAAGPSSAESDSLANYIITHCSRPVECTQRAGEVLFVPEGWNHGVVNLQDSVGIAVEVGPSSPV